MGWEIPPVRLQEINTDVQVLAVADFWELSVLT